MGEVVSILVRKRNDERLLLDAYRSAMERVRSELAPDAFYTLSVEPQLISDSLELIEGHSINSTDALVLRSALAIAASARSRGHELVVVAADRRLITAARAEGLATFNPEADTEEHLRELIAAP
jgi:hypothetical protein